MCIKSDEQILYEAYLKLGVVGERFDYLEI